MSTTKNSLIGFKDLLERIREHQVFNPCSPMSVHAIDQLEELFYELYRKVYPPGMVLRGKKMKCPNRKCGKTDGIVHNEIVLRHMPITVDEDGQWDWDNDTDDTVYWDTSDRNPKEAEWHCQHCMTDFDAPNVSSEGSYQCIDPECPDAGTYHDHPITKEA